MKSSETAGNDNSCMLNGSPTRMEADCLRPYLDQLLQAIERRESVMAIVGVDDDAVLAVIDECSRVLTEQAVHIVRLGRSSASHLTLSHIIQQLVSVDQGAPPSEIDELVIYLLTKYRHEHGAVLFVIEQAESLPIQTLMFFEVLLSISNDSLPQLQLILSGRPKILELVDSIDLGEIHERLSTTVRIDDCTSRPANNTPLRRFRSSYYWIYGLADSMGMSRTIVICLAVSVAIFSGIFARALYRPADETAFDGASSAAATGRTQAAIPAAALEPLSSLQIAEPKILVSPGQRQHTTTAEFADPAVLPRPERHESDSTTPRHLNEGDNVPAGEQLSRLRGDIDRIPARAKQGSKRQDSSDRSHLFNEFLSWSERAPNSDPVSASQSGTVPALSSARVTLYSIAGSASGSRLARQLAEKLKPSVTRVRTRSKNNVPEKFEVRCSTQDDRPVAETLAQLLQKSDMVWTVRTTPEARQTIAPHRFELWIPRR